MATMEWLATTAERRARAACRCGRRPAPSSCSASTTGRRAIRWRALAAKDRATISVYAGNRDYHDLIKGKLKRLAQRFEARTGSAVKVFVDTAPLMEKPLAAAAGVGWQGKHTNLVSRDFGSWLFLGAILTELALPPDAPETDHCGSCRACLDICPTNAFPAPYRLDARRCISYLTIEHKGPIPREFRAAMGNRIYGCDDCLAVCPWNKFAQATREAKLAARDDLAAPPLAELAGLDDAGFRARFRGSPIKRIGRDRFVRNVLIAIGNSGAADLVGRVVALLDDASPLVRGAAIWALTRLDRDRAAGGTGPPRRRRNGCKRAHGVGGGGVTPPKPAGIRLRRPQVLVAAALGGVALGAFAVGALAVGAMAIGRLAVGRLAVGRLAAKRVRIEHLSIGTLEVDRTPSRDRQAAVMSEPIFFASAAEWRAWLAGEPRDGDGGVVRLPQGRHRQGRGHLPGGPRRGARLRLDRRPSPRRRRALDHPLHAAETEEHLERGQHPPRRRADRPRPHASGRDGGVRSARSGPAEALFLREPQRGAGGGIREAVPRRPEGLGLVRSDAAVLPTAGDLVGDEREAGGNPAAPV